MFDTWKLFHAGYFCAALLLLSRPASALPLSLINAGCEQMNRGNYTVAINIFSSAVKNDPCSAEARRALATALLNAGREKEAIQQLMAVQQIQPGQASDLCLLADAYSRLGKTQFAIQLYKQAMLSDSAYAEARIGLAREFMAKGDLNSARLICVDSINNSRDAATKKQFKRMLNLINSRNCIQRTESNS